MPKLSLDIPHTLGRDGAAQRLKDKLAAVRSQYQSQVTDFKEEWKDHTFAFGFRVMGMDVSGSVAVEETRVCLAAELPMAAMFFKGAIEDRIRKDVGGLLSN
jgi:hypothetical protein